MQLGPHLRIAVALSAIALAQGTGCGTTPVTAPSVSTGIATTAPGPSTTASTVTSEPTSDAPLAVPNATVAFAAFGGQGVMSVKANPDDFVRVVVLLDIALGRDGAEEGVNVKSINLTDDHGAVLASMRQIIGTGRIDTIPSATTWANALDDHGTPFDGRLHSGKTRLRIEAFLTRHPRSLPTHVRVDLNGSPSAFSAEGKVEGEWPTG